MVGQPRNTAIKDRLKERRLLNLAKNRMIGKKSKVKFNDDDWWA